METIVIFDLDGTLLNTLEDLSDSTNYALRTCGFPQRMPEEIRQFVGNGVGMLIQRALPEWVSQSKAEECLSVFRAHYLTNMRNKTGPYPGILNLLDRLKAGGCKVAAVSNKFDGAVKELCRFYFGDKIPVALGERPGMAKKPAPDLVRVCLDKLDGSGNHAIYVGDSEVDIATAQNAGLPCVSVTWGFRDAAFLRTKGATVLVNTPEELGDLLLEAAAR